MTGHRGSGRVGQTLTVWLERVRVGWGDAHAHTEHEGGGEEGWHSAARAAVRSMVQRSKQR